MHDGRLDLYLSKKLQQSRSAISELIKSGAVVVNQVVINKPSFKLKAKDNVEINFPKVQNLETKLIPDFDIPIIYEDSEILVINKPSGVVVHSAPSYKGATLVDWLKYKKISLSTISGEERYGIVHRLDKETSGAMVVAKTNMAHKILSEQLQDRSMGRYYLALIDLALKNNITIDAPIARNRANRLKMGVVANGKNAKSAFMKLALSNNKTELIAAKLFSGRTHQIRVHLSTLNRHILGDELYGYKQPKNRISRVNLHAYILYMIHPKSGKKVEFYADIPNDIQEYLDKNFKKGDFEEKIKPINFMSMWS